MTVESNYSIAIATLSDWLKNPAHVFQPMRRQTNPIATCTRPFSWPLSRLHVIASNSDWVIALSATLVTG